MERGSNEGNPKIKGSKLQPKFNYFPMECLCFFKVLFGFLFLLFFLSSLLCLFFLTFFHI